MTRDYRGAVGAARQERPREGSRRGFIFTLLVLVIIVFMIVEIGIYFRTYELRQESEPNIVRSQVVTELASQYSDWKLSRTISIPLYAAWYSMTNDSSDEAKVPQTQNHSLENITWNLAWDGTRIDLGGVQRLPANSTLSAWDLRMKQMAASMGITLNTTYDNFSIGQPDPWTVQFNLSAHVYIYDPISTASIRTSMPLSINTSIVGFEDPLLGRRVRIQKNIIPAPSEPVSRLVATGQSGRGWFYGQPDIVTTDVPSVENHVTYGAENKRRIMVTNSLPLAIKYANIYGAVVVVGDDSAISFPEIDVPILINSSMSISDVPRTPFLILSDSDSAVTGIGGSAYHYMYDIEAVRNYAQCGMYTTHAGVGYSFLARLTNNLIADQMGIETTIGGLSSVVVSPKSSAVDHIYITSAAEQQKVMGLPGCDDPLSCKLPSSNPVPMRLDAQHAAIYGMTNMLCSTQRCG